MNSFSCLLVVGLLFAWIGDPILALGAPPQQLTFDGRQKSDPVFTPDGRALVFTELVQFDQLSLSRLTFSSGKVERVHPDAGTSEFGMSLSANGQKAAWLHNDGNLHVQIVVEDAKTSETVRFNPGGGFAAIRDLSMAPDGSHLLFAFPENGAGQQIFSLSSDTKQRRAITDGESFDVCPRYSADGRWIAFSSTRAGNFDIWTMAASGAGAIRLTDFEGLDTRPSWSPDGTQLAFTSLREGNYDIYVIQSDGSNLRRVTTHPERDDHACWHPDGKRLVVVCQRNGREDLYLVAVP